MPITDDALQRDRCRRTQEHSTEQEESTQEHRKRNQQHVSFSEFQYFAHAPVFLNSVEQSDSPFRDHFSASVHPTSVRAGVMKLLAQHPSAVGFAPADFFSREKISRVANFPRRIFSCRTGCAVISTFLTRQIFSCGGETELRGCGLRRLKGPVP